MIRSAVTDEPLLDRSTMNDEGKHSDQVPRTVTAWLVHAIGTHPVDRPRMAAGALRRQVQSVHHDQLERVGPPERYFTSVRDPFATSNTKPRTCSVCGMNGDDLMRAMDWRTSSSRSEKDSAAQTGLIPVSC
jgi:hypothetical protein